MKKIITLLLVLISAIGAASASDRIVYNDTPLPLQAKNLLAKHFKAKVNFVKVEKTFFGSNSDYEVVLKNGTEVEFDSTGNLKSVDAGANGVPSSLVLPAISTYIKQNCKNQKIVELEIKKNNYKVELQDGRDLLFDRDGKFVREER